jgi:hypothetical protein
MNSFDVRIYNNYLTSRIAIFKAHEEMIIPYIEE